MTLICRNCGKGLADNYRFCANCGASIMFSKDKASLFHMGPKGLEVETGKIKELEDGRIQVGEKIYEPLQIPLKSITMEESMAYFRDLDECLVLNRQGRFNEALELLDKCIEFEPHAPKPLLMKAGILTNLKQFEGVEELIERAMQFGSRMEQLWLTKALFMLNTDKFDDGYRCLKKTLEINPNSVHAKMTMTQLKNQNPNDFKYLLPDLKGPIKKAYELVYDILKEIDSREWINLRTIQDLGLKVKFLEELDIEFKQSEFKEKLPKIFYTILLRKGYFALSVGKINSTEPKTLLVGDMEDLFGMNFYSTFETIQGKTLAAPFYKTVEGNYTKLQELWKNIWSEVNVRANYLFYNLEILENYLQVLRSEFK